MSLCREQRGRKLGVEGIIKAVLPQKEHNGMEILYQARFRHITRCTMSIFQIIPAKEYIRGISRIMSL